MSKHFIKPYFVGIIGLLLAVGMMAIEARAEPLTMDREAQCYGAASVAQMYDRAAAHRLALRPSQEVFGQAIAYNTGYAIGYIDSGAELTGISAESLANLWYVQNCLEKTNER